MAWPSVTSAVLSAAGGHLLRRLEAVLCGPLWSVFSERTPTTWDLVSEPHDTSPIPPHLTSPRLTLLAPLLHCLLGLPARNNDTRALVAQPKTQAANQAQGPESISEIRPPSRELASDLERDLSPRPSHLDPQSSHLDQLTSHTLVGASCPARTARTPSLQTAGTDDLVCHPSS